MDFILQIFFVLRKKNNQVTALHLYHHVLMALGTWMFSRNLVGKPKGLEVSIKADTAFHQSGMKHIYLPNKSS
jgi:hypothetical protein